ncbi:hypothetical protein [Photorhabdus sp. SF281]
MSVFATMPAQTFWDELAILLSSAVQQWLVGNLRGFIHKHRNDDG